MNEKIKKAIKEFEKAQKHYNNMQAYAHKASQGEQFYNTLTSCENQFYIKLTGNKKMIDNKITAVEFADTSGRVYYVNETLLKNFDITSETQFLTGGIKTPIRILENGFDISGLLMPINIY